MNIDNFREKNLTNVTKIICDQEFFRELVDFPNMILKNHIYYYKNIPITIDENLKYKTCKLLYENNNNFYNDIVENLKKEARALNNKLEVIRNRTDREDFNTYISVLKSLRETLNLINEYDWKLMYSEYEVINDDNTKQKQVSIWYANHDKQIKDHKYWNIIGNRIDVPNNI